MDGTKSEQQEVEWREAQSIVLTPDLLSLTKKQLVFLAAVDRHRSLYRDGPVLDRAINRYKNCWLPLLAKHQQQYSATETSTPLVVPLDCEWIWHCHRLSPVQYKKDCELNFRKILDNHNVRSTIEEGISDEEEATMKLWQKLYPGEPYQPNYREDCLDVAGYSAASPAVTINCDLVAAVKRKPSFGYQVSSPSMRDRQFLEAALARYKGFLHLIRKNREKSLNLTAVPTYDVDLMWHTHQLQPLSYSKDLTRLVGMVVNHDDTTKERGKGTKLHVGFTGTTELWAETYGSRYWTAGAMYRGSIPSPVVTTPYEGSAFDISAALPCSYQKHLPLSNTNFVDVMLEVVDVKNVPAKLRGSLFVSFRKSNADVFFYADRRLDIQSEAEEGERARFLCEPTGDIILTLGSETNHQKNIGTVSITLKDIVEGDSKLPLEKWLELKMEPGNGIPTTISLRVAVSSTVATPAPYVFLPFPGKEGQKNVSHFMDVHGKEILQMSLRSDKSSDVKQVVGSLGANGDTPRVLAEFVSDAWSFLDSNFILSLDNNTHEDGHIFELRGQHPIKLFPGRRLEFEAKSSGPQDNEKEDFLTVVHFSSNEPYGKALALVNIKTGYLMVNEEWFVLHGLVLAFILWRMVKSEGHGIFTAVTECKDATYSLHQENSYPNTSNEQKMECTIVFCGGMCEDATKMGASIEAEKISPCQSGPCIAGCSISYPSAPFRGACFMCLGNVQVSGSTKMGASIEAEKISAGKVSGLCVGGCFFSQAEKISAGKVSGLCVGGCFFSHPITEGEHGPPYGAPKMEASMEAECNQECSVGFCQCEHSDEQYGPSNDCNGVEKRDISYNGEYLSDLDNGSSSLESNIHVVKVA